MRKKIIEGFFVYPLYPLRYISIHSCQHHSAITSNFLSSSTPISCSHIRFSYLVQISVEHKWRMLVVTKLDHIKIIDIGNVTWFTNTSIFIFFPITTPIKFLTLSFCTFVTAIVTTRRCNVWRKASKLKKTSWGLAGPCSAQVGLAVFQLNFGLTKDLVP